MIIQSLLDTDLYKFTMMQVVLHRFSSAEVEYNFKCRSAGIHFEPYAEEIAAEIKALCNLRLNDDELQYLSNLPYVTPDFIEFLRAFQLNDEYIQIQTQPEFQLIIKGPWLDTILFEIPVLAIISEVYMRNHYPNVDRSEGKRRLVDKITFVKSQPNNQEFKFTDFGTRRRYARDWQSKVVAAFKHELPLHFTGTSNVYLAKELDLTPIGTMAHEYIQACQALAPQLRDSQRFAFQNWLDEYQGKLGIALSDTYTLDVFLADFDLYFSKSFDGARQDSGDPIEWTERMLEHYQVFNIDPNTKTLIYSDSLTFPKAFVIYQKFLGRVNMSFGIGSNLTNDMGVPAVDMVIKMVRCNQQPVAKFSDSPGKSISPDQAYLNYLKQVFKIKN